MNVIDQVNPDETGYKCECSLSLKLFLNDGHQKVSNKGSPYLNGDCIFIVS